MLNRERKREKIKKKKKKRRRQRGRRGDRERGVQKKRGQEREEKMTGDAGQNSKMLATAQNSKKSGLNSLDCDFFYILSDVLLF